MTAVALSGLALGSACARPAGLQQTGASLPESNQVAPFHQSPASASDRTLAIPQDSKPATTLPFHALHDSVLPSGTFLTVKLDRSLVPAKVHSGDPFIAFIAGPVMIDSRTVIESGTGVIGRVESAQASSVSLGPNGSGRRQSKGYVQLTLTSLVVEGKQLPLQTSSLFARGTSSRSDALPKEPDTDTQSDIVRVQKGRRLTFRLIAPTPLDNAHSVAALDAAKE